MYLSLSSFFPSLSLSLRGEEEGQRPGPSPAGRFAHLQFKAGVNSPRDFLRRGSVVPWGHPFSTRFMETQSKKIPWSYEKGLTNSRLGRVAADYSKGGLP